MAQLYLCVLYVGRYNRRYRKEDTIRKAGISRKVGIRKVGTGKVEGRYTLERY